MIKFCTETEQDTPFHDQFEARVANHPDPCGIKLLQAAGNGILDSKANVVISNFALAAFHLHWAINVRQIRHLPR